MLKIKIVPTQLLGHSDGSMSQGFSTLYDLRNIIADPYSDIMVKLCELLESPMKVG